MRSIVFKDIQKTYMNVEPIKTTMGCLTCNILHNIDNITIKVYKTQRLNLYLCIVHG